MCALVTGVHTCALPISSALLMGISCSTESGGRRQQGGTAARRHYKPSSVAFAFGLAGGVGMGGVADAAAFGLAALQPEARLLSLWPVDDEGELHRLPAGTGIEGREADVVARRSEEHTSELQSLMRISYAVFCLKKKK